MNLMFEAHMLQKHRITRRTMLTGMTAGLCAAATSPSFSQQFAAGPMKLVVGLGAGSGPDVVCRIVAEHLSGLWGEQVAVVNQAGATGGIAMRTVGSSAPDGRTLLFALSSSFVALPEIQSTFPYDLSRDFVPVGLVGEVPMAIAASAALGVTTLPDFIALAKQQAGRINVAVSNRGGTPHLTAEWLRMTIGADMTAISYPGTPQALADVVSGRVQATVDSLPGLRGAIDGGSVKLLAVCSPQRLPNLPNAPAAAETLPGFSSVGWYALMAPPGTPNATAQKLSQDLRTVLDRAELRTRLQDIGFYVRPMTPTQLQEFIGREQAQWKPVIEQIGLKSK
jgi:tripartite-type tricarboxylate transporter receptor subunit TctC